MRTLRSVWTPGRAVLPSVTVLLLAAFLSGCGTQGESRSPSPSGGSTSPSSPGSDGSSEQAGDSATQALLGHTWRLTRLGREGQQDLDLSTVAGTLVFEVGQARFDAGCNTMTGPVEVQATSLVAGPMRSTRMGCPPEVAEVESAIGALLEGTVAIEWRSNLQFVLRRDGAVAVFDTSA